MAIREELQRREDALNQLEKDLNEKSRLLETESAGGRTRVALEARERAAEALRARLSEALLGFQGKASTWSNATARCTSAWRPNCCSPLEAQRWTWKGKPP